jgi:hypothetical protein
VRPVSDIAAIENASHGPLGSLVLLIKRRGGLHSLYTKKKKTPPESPSIYISNQYDSILKPNKKKKKKKEETSKQASGN